MSVPHRTQNFPFGGGAIGPVAGGPQAAGGGGGGPEEETSGPRGGGGGGGFGAGGGATQATGPTAPPGPDPATVGVPVWGSVKPHLGQNNAPSAARVPQCMQTATSGRRYMRYLTVREVVRHRSVALVTRDPALYGELAGFLREQRWPTVSLLPGQRIPENVVAVLTSAEEASLISHRHVLPVAPGGDRHALTAAVEQAFDTGDSEEELIVGFDPGPRPGYAILVGRRCLGTGVLDAPESTGAFASQIRHRFPSRPLRFRVGAGDPPSRNRIVNALLGHQRWVELVNERGTTPRGRRRPRDPEAARTIAMSRGTLIRESLPTTFTSGEVSNLQRLSRERSGGRLTISRTSAHRVLRGELTLAEAVDEARRPAARDRGPRPASSEPL
jgi:hypothetical protein